MSNIDRQREHQANERTFLAWLRTSIALVGFGFALAKRARKRIRPLWSISA